MFRMALYLALDYFPQFYVDIICFIVVKVMAFRQVSKHSLILVKLLVIIKHVITYDYITLM